ncbi:MAG: Do family serine endopeptidase [Acidobacteria bacterium]|nr:Do family serine endopeptidase [Acidobacteriota bacterium]
MNVLDKVKQQKFLSMSMLLATLAIGILIGTVVNTGVKAAKEQQAAPDATPLVVPAAQTAPNEFTALAKRLEPTVVNISTDYTPKAASQRKRRPQADDDDDEGGDEPTPDFLRRFFGNQPFGGGGGGGPQAGPRPFKRQGTGTGFIVDPNGYIITNHHVIDKADHIKVKIQGDAVEHKAKVIGSDIETDIAVIKIAAGRQLLPAKIGNSEAVQVGDWAVAIGSPFGLEATVTAGIVSAKGRDINSPAQFQRFIQTDAAINPGNSGGPLLNIRGEVIGVNTAIATESGGNQGVGFALPMNLAVKVYNSIIKHGRVTRGSIGITFNKNDKPETLKAMGYSGGVIVGDVKKDGPAHKAGLRAEDIILAINGKSVKDGDDLVARVADTPIGDSVTLQVDRNGVKQDFKVVIADRLEIFRDDPRVSGNRTPEPTREESASQAKFGIAIRPLGDQERERFGLKDDIKGVLVTRVEEDSFADEIGLQDNDLIVSINRQPVGSTDDVRRVQSSLKPGDPVAFRVMRTPAAALRGQGRAEWQTFYVSGTLPNN